MKSKIITVASILSASVAVTYAIVSFVMWQFDPSQWSESARFHMVLFAIVVSAIGMGAAFGSDVFEEK